MWYSCVRATRTWKHVKLIPTTAVLIAMVIAVAVWEPAYAMKPVVLDDDATVHTLGLYADVLEDPKGTVTLESILRGDHDARFAPSASDAPNYGFTTSVYWARFQIRNVRDVPMERFLEIAYPILNHAELHVPEPGGGYTVRIGGNSYPFGKRDLQYRNLVFKIDIRPGDQVLYLRIKTQSSMCFPLILQSPTSFSETVLNEYIVFGLYYGILLVMIIYNLFVFLSVRDVNYVYYIVYILGYLLAVLSHNGLAFQYLWPDSLFWARICVPFFILFVTMLAIPQFSRSFLKMSTYAPWIDRVLIGQIAIGVGMMVATFFVRYSIIMPLTSVLAVISITISFIGGIVCLVRGYRAARFYVIAWTVLTIGMALWFCQAVGILPYNFITKYSNQVGSAAEVVLLALALADRINILKKEKEEVQDELIGMQKSYSQSLEKTVQERTSELELKTRELESERNRLKRRNEMMEREVNLARRIQEQLIPSHNPTGYIASLYRPMEQVGGDFFDFIMFDDSDRIGIFLSDVSGHGVPAAFITSMVKTIILEAGPRNENPAALLSYINAILFRQTGGNFITAYYGIYDRGDRTILYANAGHFPPFIIAGGAISTLMGRSSVPLATLHNKYLEDAGKSYVNNVVQLPDAGKVLLYTDGFTEAQPVEAPGRFFEYNGMAEALTTHAHLPSREFLEKVFNRLIEYRGEETFDDDVCLICLDVF